MRFYCEEIVEMVENSCYEEFVGNNQLSFAIAFAMTQIAHNAIKLIEEFQKDNDKFLWYSFVAFGREVSQNYVILGKDIIWDVANTMARLLEEIDNMEAKDFS